MPNSIRAHTLVSASKKRPAAPVASPASPAAPTLPPSPVRLDAYPSGDEARRTLLGIAHRRTASIPAPLLVEHAISVARGGGWPVERAALEAIIRRIALHAQDDLRVSARPRKGPFGPYATKKRRGASRPYDVRLDSLDPLRGSCTCDDYLRNSLGLCKHLIAVVQDLAKQARRFEKWLALRPQPPATPRLRWDPVRPLTGPGDWIEGLRLTIPVPPPSVAHWFQRRHGERDVFAISADRVSDPVDRSAFVTAIERAVGPGSRAPIDADPAVIGLLREERRRLDSRAASHGPLGALLGALRTLKQPLYPYQRTGVERFLSTGCLLLADDMGLGKTAQAIASCHALWVTHRVERGLLIVPAALKPQWAREWALFTDAPLTIVDGDPSERAATYRKTKKGFLVANYEQVLRDLELMHDWHPDLVVLDEAQRIKNFASKTAVFVKRLDPRLRLVLTGTPMENRLEELSSLLDWVDDRALEPIWRLAPWHTAPPEGGGESKGARHLDTLRLRLSGCMLRRVRKDVLTQLPPRTDTRVPVELTEEQREAHDELAQPIAQLASIARTRPLSQAQFLRLMSLLTTQRVISNGIAQLHFERDWPAISKIRRPDDRAIHGLFMPKLVELREILSQIVVAQGRKAVVFSQWRRMLLLSHWATRDLLADAGVRTAFFTGAEGAKTRERNIVEFHDDPDMRVLFASDAGGVGLNLQRAASCCINLELPWNPAVLEQRIGRIHRMGQTKPIDVYALVSQGCIESRIADIVGDKRALFTGLFDGTADDVRFERSGSFLSRLETIVAPVSVPTLKPHATPSSEPEPEAQAAADETIDAVVAAADESRDRASIPAPPTSMSPEGGARSSASDAGPVVDVRELFSQLTIRRSPSGVVSIDAPLAAAATLAELFEGMAGLLRRSSGDGASATSR